MPHPLAPPTSPITDTDALAALHASVVGSEVPDETYSTPISNKEKVEYACRHAGLNVGQFDLIQAFPFAEWAESQDQRLITTGLFVTDLQLEFYDKWINGAPKMASHKLWEAHAETEFWHGCFKVENVFLRFGADLILDRSIN